MKVLSLTEPYATLIQEKKKQIETRSWATNYRGELYIHASATKMTKDLKDKKELMKLVQHSSMNFGKIICKCNLVDCIYMTKEYIENIKKNHPQEYLCGDYQVGRYAWILDGITPLKTPLEAKGQLGIWNYYSESEIMDLINQIDYGWVDKDKQKHIHFNDSFAKDYCLQSPKEMIHHKVGICWDQVELERYYFKNHHFKIQTFFIVYYDDECPTHTFLTYEKNGKFYWFEHSWEKFKGIHEYPTEKDLLRDVKQKFIDFDAILEPQNIVLYEYQKPKYHISVADFYKHCEHGKIIEK